MITEDYVSFEVAKLLKEKGFDVKTLMVYSQNGSFIPNGVIEDTYQTFYNAPTHQMTMKWLRDEKNILLYVYPVIVLPVKNDYTFYWRWEGKKKRHDAPHIGGKHNYESFEEALEAALKYCLENLI